MQVSAANFARDFPLSARLGIGYTSFDPGNAAARKIFIIEYYFSSRLRGHDTSYSPDGENVNPREEYTYNDANEAINRPGIEFRLMIGLQYHF
jgi:hypothetical protein